MTKYLIIFLIIFIAFLSLILIILPRFYNQGSRKYTPSPFPILVAPSSSPSVIQQPEKVISTEEQIRLQSQADKDFAEKTKQTATLYPWLDKLPIQYQNYYAYFDIDEKQFIAKLYPSSSSNIPIDQQVSDLKKEVETKLQSLIPDYGKYNIRWDIKPE